MGCGIADMEVTKFINRGLATKYFLKCKVCGTTKHLDTETDKPTTYKINDAVVLGAVSTGVGYSQCEELFTTMNVPFMAKGTFQTSFDSIADKIHETALLLMEEAGREEKQLAIDLGDVDTEGYPCITVIADGAWSKRSYGLNYNALSGVVSIIFIHIFLTK